MSLFSRFKEKVKESIGYLDSSDLQLLDEDAQQTQAEHRELLRELKASVNNVALCKFPVAHDAVEERRNEENDNLNKDEDPQTPTEGNIHFKSLDVSQNALNDSNLLVRDMMVWMERSIWHGLRRENNEIVTQPTRKNLSLWNLLNHLKLLPVATLEPEIIETLQLVSSCKTITSDVGRSRAWMRLALNKQVLERTLSQLFTRRSLMALYYESYALLRDEEALSVFLSIILALNGIKFDFDWSNKVFDEWKEPIRRPTIIKAQGKSVVRSLHLRKPKMHSRPQKRTWVYDVLLEQQTRNSFSESRIPMSMLVRNPEHCVSARLDWRIGIPDIISRCLCLLRTSRNLNHKLLFDSTLTANRMSKTQLEFVKSLENLAGNDLRIMNQVDVDVKFEVAALSVQASTLAGIGTTEGFSFLAQDSIFIGNLLKTVMSWLNAPLLPLEKHDALIACLEIEDKDARNRNLSFLIDTIACENKPTFKILLDVLAVAVNSPEGEQDCVNTEDISRRMAPIFYHPSVMKSEEGAAKAEAVLKIIIENKEVVLSKALTTLVSLKKRLSDKLSRLRQRSKETSLSVDATDPIVLEDLKFLWYELAEQNDSTQFNLESPGWQKRGFRSSVAINDFRGGGVTGVKDLVYFVKKHRVKARQMAHNVLPSEVNFPFVQAAVQISTMTSSILGLSGQEFIDSGEVEARDRIAMQPWWHMLDERDSPERVFCMSFLLFDINFVQAKATIRQFFKIKQETKKQMERLLSAGPSTVDELWHSWIQMRAAEDKIGSVVSSRVSANREKTSESSKEEKGTSENHGSSSAERNDNEESNHDETHGNDLHADVVQYLPVLHGSTNILNQNILMKIEASLPVNYQGYDWILIFSTAKHRASVDTLYSQCENHQATLLFVKDTKGMVFGGFNTTNWRIEPNYYGNGESFLFSFKEGFRLYQCTKKNSYFMLASDDSLAMGGGSGGFGLYLDGDLKAGTSSASETYGNDCLADSEDFDCDAVEIWAFKNKI